MKDPTKYQGVIPAFYACYDKDGGVSPEGVKALTRHLIAKGVKGVYVGGSSGECIYQHPARASRASMWAALRASASTSTPTSARPCWRPS